MFVLSCVGEFFLLAVCAARANGPLAMTACWPRAVEEEMRRDCRDHRSEGGGFMGFIQLKVVWARMCHPEKSGFF